MEQTGRDRFEAVVIGGGAAGLNAALMLARSRRTVAVIDGGEPRNAPSPAAHAMLGHDGVAPRELLRRGRAEVEGYGGITIRSEVVAAERRGDRFDIALADGRTMEARGVVVATGIRDELPEVDGLARHWGRTVVHCPYCHGWEVRDRAVGVLAGGPGSTHQALLFHQLAGDVVFFANGHPIAETDAARFAALGIPVVDERVVAVHGEREVEAVELEGGRVVARGALAVAARFSPRLDGLDGLGLEVADHPSGMGRAVVVGMAASTAVTGLKAAGNVTDPMAQLGASAAAGALAGAHLNAELAAADADAAVERAASAERSAGGSDLQLAHARRVVLLTAPSSC